MTFFEEQRHIFKSKNNYEKLNYTCSIYFFNSEVSDTLFCLMCKKKKKNADVNNLKINYLDSLIK